MKKIELFHKKVEIKALIEVIAVFGIIALLFSGFYLLEAGITGFTIAEKQFNYSDTIGLTVNENSNYTWVLGNPGEIKSIKLSGSIEGESARVYLEKDNERYLVFDSSRLEDGLGGITGFSVLNETEEDSTTEVNETEEINETIEETNKSITINLGYNGNSNYDVDNDGVETLQGIIDFSVENSLFGFAADESKLCARWSTYNIESKEEVVVCYGSSDCCSLAGLAPAMENWNDVFYSYYGQNGAGSDNVISAQVIYADYNLSVEEPYSDILYSEWANLTAKYSERGVLFDDICVETCVLYGFNKSSYKLIFEINDAVLHLDSVKYTVIEEIVNNPPSLMKNISDILISGNYTIDLSEYFYDDDLLSYSYYETDNISVVIEDGIATIVPDYGFAGTRYLFFKANDSLLSSVSNVFMVNVSGENVSIAARDEIVNKTRIIINRPVKWLKNVKLDTAKTKVVVNLTVGARNITVNKIKEGVEEEILSGKIKVNESGVVKDLEEYESGMEEISAGTLPTEEKDLLPITGMFTAITGFAVEEEAVDYTNSTEIIIEEEVEEVEVEYYTKGPVSVEKIINENKKQIVISSDIHYEDVLAYTFIEEAPVGAVKLYWVKDSGREIVSCDKYDTNDNGLVDYIEWNVPSLSNQTYEVEITILNVQSYPTVGGYWTVMFETSGMANLTISASNGTQYGVDLEFTEVRCGDEVMDVNFDGTNVFYENWNCSLTGYHKVKVLSEGVHTQMFVFGDSVGYANNYAGGIPQTMSIQGKLTNKSGDLINKTLNFSFKIYDQFTDGELLWHENQTLFVEEGIYSAILGSVTAINVSFDQQLHLGIAVGTDAEMVPRLNLSSAPSAYRAIVAENLTCTDCLDATQIEDIYVLNTGDTVSGDLKVEGEFNATSNEGSIIVDEYGNVKIGI